MTAINLTIYHIGRYSHLVVIVLLNTDQPGEIVNISPSLLLFAFAVVAFVVDL